MLPAVRCVLLAVTLALPLASPAAAQAPAPLTFDQAVAQALGASPAIRVARARLQRAEADASVARAAWFPRASFTEAAHRGDQPVFVFSSLLSARRFESANFAIDALNHPQALSFYQRAVGVEQVLFDGGRTAAAVRTSRLTRDSADLGVTQAASDLVVSLAEQYGRVLAGESRKRAAEAAVSAALEDVARAERQRDAGRATDADVLAMSAHVAGARQRVIAADGDATIARAQVNRLRNAPVDAIFAAVEPAPRPAADGASLDELIRAATAARPDVLQAAAAERIARQASSDARAALWPRVIAQAAYESDGLAFGTRTSGWAAGVDLRWSISTGGAELARTRSAAAGLAEARAAVDAAHASAAADIVGARERRRSASARFDVGRAAVAQARESERITRDRYDAGLATVNDVLRASALTLDAETARIDAVVDALVADALFDRATGRDPFASR